MELATHPESAADHAPNERTTAKLRRILLLALCFSALQLGSVAHAGLPFPIAQPGTEGLQVIVTSNAPIVATYHGNSALFSNDLYLALDASGNPGDDGNVTNDRFIFNNHASPVGSTASLGSFPIGTELIFRLHVNNSGNNFYTGPASRNPDGHTHARVQGNWQASETLVSFEDLFNGPFNYNDLSFSFTNTGSLACPAATGQVAVAYNSALVAIGMTPPYNFRVIGSLPIGLMLDASSGAVAGTPTLTGSVSFAATVTDSAGLTAHSDCVIDVMSCNPYRYQVQALDADGDQLTFTLQTGPSGMAVDSATGLITWDPNANQRGPHAVTVTVDDGRGGFDEQTFVLTVIDEPPVAKDDAYSVQVNETLEIRAPGVLANDLDPEQAPLTAQLVRGPSNGTLQLLADGSFSYEPNAPEPIPGGLDPIVEWSWTTPAVEPTFKQLIVTLVTANLTDDNSDGKIDEGDIPDVIFPTTNQITDGNLCLDNGILRAISGAGGGSVFDVTDMALRVANCVTPAVADLDNDGSPEIIAFQHGTRRLVILNHDGTLERFSEALGFDQLVGPSPSVADLDHDGSPEVVLGATVFDRSGHILFSHPDVGNNDFGPISTTADLDLDGTLEVVSGFRAYRADGSIFYDSGSSGGYPAIGNFDADAYPEVVVVSSGNVYLLEHDGTVKWGPKPLPNGGRGGPPTVADVDADGEPEIGVAAATRFTVFETDGSIKWSAEIRDTSSNFTGSSVFDFENDGQAEIVYNDELKLRIYRGSTGEVLFETPNSSCTAMEYPIIVDVDNDGHAEILVSRNNMCGFGTSIGLTEFGVFAYGGRANNWVRTRRIWNQHAYHITNVNEDASIPQFEAPNWLIPGLNNFRLNSFLPGDPESADTFTYTANDGASDSNVATVSITIRPPNSPPQFVSEPMPGAIAGLPYVYPVLATDPDPGDQLTFSLPLAPAGMTVDSATGVVRWTPDASQIGSNGVTVRVEDSMGLFALQPYTVSVAAGDIDDDGDGFSEVQGDCDDTNSAIHPGAIDVPENGLDEDCMGGDAELLPTSIEVRPSASTLLTGQSQQLAAIGTFPNGSTQDITGDVTWESLAPTIASVSPSGAVQALVGGSAEIVARKDGVEGSATVSVLARDIGDTTLPTVAITSPALDTDLKTPVEILGTADDANFLRYELELLDSNRTLVKILATGSQPVVDGVLGSLDPTLLPNGVYIVNLRAHDRGGNSNTALTRVSVSGELKLGNFRLTFTDLTIPVAGIPLSIIRTYDSLDTTQGDFGAGWRLGYPGQVVDSARENPFEAFTDQTRVYVTKPDGKRVGFSFVAQCALLGCVPSFRADPGVFDTLSTAPELLFRSGAQREYFSFFNGAFNPRTYVLTTKEKVKYTIDELEGLKHIEDANGNTLKFTPAGVESSTGVSLAFERDAAGRIKKVIEPVEPGSSDPAPFLEYVYDASGNLTGFFDQMRHETEYFYEDGRFPHYLTRIVDPLGRPTIRSVFNDQGQLIGLCDANGDPATLLGCTKLAPDASAQQQTIVNARGFTTDLFLDARGNVLTERRWLDGTKFLDTVRTYDANDNLLTETDPEGNVKSFAYDLRGNQLTRTEGGRTTTFTYNACNQVLTEIDPATNLTKYDYDATGCLVRFVTNALNDITEYQYNPQGQVSDFIDANGVHWHWDYDSAGFLERMTDSLGKMATYDFSPAGDLLFRVDREGQRIDFDYDDAHRLKTETWDTTPPRVTTYGYSDAGPLTSAVDPDSALTLTYHPTGRLETVDNNGTPGAPRVVITYGYDGNGNVTSVGDSLGGLTRYQYDGLDRLDRITQTGTDVNEKRVDLRYDDASLLRELHRFSNLAGTQGVANTFYDYDCGGCAGRLTQIHHRKASDGSVIHDLDFVRDTMGDIRQMTDAEGLHTYTYDDIRQRKTATHPMGGPQPNESYAYDDVGNRLTSHLSSSYSYTPNSNRLEQDDQFTYEYDDNGSLILRTDRATGQTTSFIYDHRHRLGRVVRSEMDGTELDRIEYTYDSANRRIRSIEGGGSVTLSAYDGLNPAITLTNLGQVVNRRLYTPDLDRVLAEDSGGASRWFIGDQVRSTRDLVDTDAALVAHYTYDSFGRVIESSNLGAQTFLLFGAREADSSLGLTYLRARYYSGDLGRFLRQDPLTPFAYAYAGNNPLVFIDPLGLTTTYEYALKAVKISLPIVAGIAANCVERGEFSGVIGGAIAGAALTLLEFKFESKWDLVGGAVKGTAPNFGILLFCQVARSELSSRWAEIQDVLCRCGQSS